LLIKNSNDIIVLVNEKGEQTFVSDVVENITGYTAEELYGNILDVIHPDDVELVSQHWTEVLSNPKKPARVQYRHKHKVKGYVWLEAVAQNFFDNPSIKSIVANIRDITNNKESETKLIKLNATKDKLFSIIAHDLRSPLSSITGFSELLIDNIETTDIEKAKKYAAVINTSAKNNLVLVDNLLTWAKTQTGQIEFEPENLELKPIVEESLMVLNTSASLKEIKLINSVSGDIVACADQNMLKTILRNLVQNAIKFTESNGKIVINAVSNPDHIEISVTDNGVGITEENQKKLFGADLNFSMQGTENESGTGLGLMLCMEFVEKHGGKIWVESQVGKGSKFLFTLPVATKNTDKI
ncbi:MAG: ATP-binding protein, partial [Bacteroidales bacterium]